MSETSKAIKLSGLPLMAALDLENSLYIPTGMDFKRFSKLAPSNGNRARTMDSDSYDLIVGIAAGLSLNVASNYLTEWIKHLFKKYKIKKLKIENDEIGADNPNSQVIYQIIIKNININHREEDSEE